MMGPRNAVQKTLADHEARITKLEALLGSPKLVAKKPGKQNTLSDHIIRLRDSAFFTKPRNADEVHKKLQLTYQCDPNRVAVALYRLASRKKLRKAQATLNGKTYQAYVW